MKRVAIYLFLAVCLIPFFAMIWAPEAFSRGLAFFQANLLLATVLPIYTNVYLAVISYQDSPRRFKTPMAVVSAVGALATLIWLYSNLTFQNFWIATLIPVTYKFLAIFALEYERHAKSSNS